MNKVILALTIVAVTALYPLTSVSKSTLDDTQVTITGDNTLVLNGEVNGDSVADVMTKAKELDGALDTVKEKCLLKKRPLYLFISSPGGSIQSGLELIEALKGLGRPVHTITSFSASMAFQIAQNLDDRLIVKSGTLMSHHAAGEIAGSFGGVSTQMDSRYGFWLQRIKELDEQTVKRTNGKQTYQSYTKQYDHEMWLTGTQSVEQGYADRVVTVKCDKSLSGVSTKHLNFMGVDVLYDLDNCPLNTNPMNFRIGGNAKNVNPEYFDHVKASFLAQYQAKQRQAIPMYW